MTRRCIPGIAAAALLMAAQQSGAQQPAAGVFKGKVAEGQYEVRTEIDLTGAPGVPRDKQKSSGMRSRCVTRQEIDNGVVSGGDCSVTKYSESPGAARILMACKDGNVSDMKYTFAPGEFGSETVTTGKEGGRPFTSLFRSSAKLVGPCLAAPAGKAAAPK
jgi:hypothetical protein